MLSGSPGMGKSSVARALLQRYPRGLHLPVDDLRELVVSGLVHPGPDHPPEAVRQFALARRAAAFHTRLYKKAGWRGLDTSNLSIEQTVEALLA